MVKGAVTNLFVYGRRISVSFYQITPFKSLSAFFCSTTRRLFLFHQCHNSMLYKCVLNRHFLSDGGIRKFRPCKTPKKASQQIEQISRSLATDLPSAASAASAASAPDPAITHSQPPSPKEWASQSSQLLAYIDIASLPTSPGAPPPRLR